MDSAFTAIASSEMAGYHEEQCTAIIDQQEKPFEEVVCNDDDKMLPVEGYRKLSSDLAGAIRVRHASCMQLVPAAGSAWQRYQGLELSR